MYGPETSVLITINSNQGFKVFRGIRKLVAIRFFQTKVGYKRNHLVTAPEPKPLYSLDFTHSEVFQRYLFDKNFTLRRGLGTADIYNLQEGARCGKI